MAVSPHDFSVPLIEAIVCVRAIVALITINLSAIVSGFRTGPAQQAEHTRNCHHRRREKAMGSGIRAFQACSRLS